MKVFGVFYTPDCNEQLLSLHKTREGKKGADAAVKKFCSPLDERDCFSWESKEKYIEFRQKYYRMNVKELEVQG